MLLHRTRTSDSVATSLRKRKRAPQSSAVGSAEVDELEPRFVWALHPDIRGGDRFKHWWPAVREKRRDGTEHAKRARRSSLTLSRRRNKTDNTVEVRWFFPGERGAYSSSESPTFCEQHGVRSSYELVLEHEIQPFLDTPAPGVLAPIFGSQCKGTPVPTLCTLRRMLVDTLAVVGESEGVRQQELPTAGALQSSPAQSQRQTLALPTRLFGSGEEYADALSRSVMIALRAAGREAPFEGGDNDNTMKTSACPGPGQSGGGNLHSQSEGLSRLTGQGSSALSQLPSTPGESLATSLSLPLPWNDSQGALEGENEKGKGSSARPHDQEHEGDREMAKDRCVRSPLLRELSQAGETPREEIRLQGRYELVSSRALSDGSGKTRGTHVHGSGAGVGKGTEDDENEDDNERDNEEFFVRWAGEWGFVSDFALSDGLRSRFEFRCAIPAARAREVIRQRGGWTLYR